MSRIVDKLVEASGGWEKFLYETLRDVVEAVGRCGFTGDGEDSINCAQEILDTYDDSIKDRWVEQSKKHNGKPIHMPSTKVQPVVEDASKVVEASKPATLGESKPAHPDRFEPPKPKPQPAAMTARIQVDTEVGASQGELPVPADHMLCHRENMTVETQGGLELGRGSADGQVRGPGASGHVTLDGKYRLVFTDTTLGFGLLYYTVIQVEKKEVPAMPFTPSQYKPNFQLEKKYPTKPSRPPLEVIGEAEIRKKDKEEVKKEE